MKKVNMFMLKEINLEEDIKRVIKFDEEELSSISVREIEQYKPKKGKTRKLSSDIMFKSVFLNEPDILLKMIKDIFNISDDDINNPLVISGYESVPYTYYGKTFKNDLLVKLSDDSYVIIDMNNKSNRSVLDRNLIQLFRIQGQIINKGELYNNLKNYKVMGLNFNYKVGKSINEIDRFSFCNIETGEIASKLITIVNIDVEKKLQNSI